MPTTPELLVPAADKAKLATALTYGADAVYLGGQDLNLRAKSGGFSFPELRWACDLAHVRGVRVYFALNLLAWEEHLTAVARYLDELGDSGVDALIIADPGILDMARRQTPHLPLHLSTQANTSNSAAARFWRDQGVHRVNLARELGARRLRAVTENVPGLEFEAFVHGAMCMAVSGRCLLSAHVNQRPANQGLCTHPCRFDYKITAVRVEERLRPGADMWELWNEDCYTQIMSAEDLCLIKYLRWFQRVGVHSLKIEGRMKTTSYLAQVTDVYRTALNDLHSNSFRPALYLDELRNIATRPLSTGFFTPTQKILAHPLPRGQRRHIVARLEEERGPGHWRIAVKHRFQDDVSLEILVPGLSRPRLNPSDYGLENQAGARLHEVHSGVDLVLRCTHPALAPGLFLRLAVSEEFRPSP